MSAGIRTTGPTPGARAVERGESCLGDLPHTHSNCSRDAGIELNDGEGVHRPSSQITTYLGQVRGGKGGWKHRPSLLEGSPLVEKSRQVPAPALKDPVCLPTLVSPRSSGPKSPACEQSFPKAGFATPDS